MLVCDFWNLDSSSEDCEGIERVLCFKWCDAVLSDGRSCANYKTGAERGMRNCGVRAIAWPRMMHFMCSQPASPACDFFWFLSRFPSIAWTYPPVTHHGHHASEIHNLPKRKPHGKFWTRLICKDLLGGKLCLILSALSASLRFRVYRKRFPRSFSLISFDLEDFFRRAPRLSRTDQNRQPPISE